MSTLQEWVDYCLDLAAEPADLWSGARKILRTRTLTFNKLDDSLQLADVGFTKSKLTMLTKNYLHLESRQAAVDMWEYRKSRKKYGSVSFTTFNHFVKGKGSVQDVIDGPRSKRSSVFGPCIQSVSITWVNKDLVSIDIFYRTTELFKKFPADLVFIRDVLLEPFNFEGANLVFNFYFANITIHPMYAVTFIPHLKNPMRDLDCLKKHDKFFYDWVVKWSARYVCDEHHRGIAKFAQALRVQMDARNRIQNLDKFANYLRDNHPGHRNQYEEESDDE